MMSREISKQFLHSSQQWPESAPKSLPSTRVALCRAPGDNKGNMGKGGMSAHYQHCETLWKRLWWEEPGTLCKANLWLLEDSLQADGTAENLATNKHSQGTWSVRKSVFDFSFCSFCCLFALHPWEQELVFVQPLHSSTLTVPALHTSLQQWWITLCQVQHMIMKWKKESEKALILELGNLLRSNSKALVTSKDLEHSFHSLSLFKALFPGSEKVTKARP